MSRWNDELVEQLKALVADGLSASQIAARLPGKFSRNAIIGKATRIGLGPIGGGKAAAPAKAPKRIAPTAPRGFGSIGLKAPAVKREGAGRNGLHITEAKSVTGWKAPRHVEDVTLAKDLFGRAYGECAAPVSGEGADTLFCCHPVVEGKPYCATHASRFLTRPATQASDLARLLRRVA